MAQKEVVNFRKNLAELCAEHGAIQRIADAASLSRVYLSNIIHGHATPTLESAGKIASALSVPLGVLVDAPSNLKKNLAKAS